MKKLCVSLLFLLLFLIPIGSSHAVEDPLSKPNNFYGIHILFPQELEPAKDLINSTGGDWGYVTIPIQATDMDLEKWQEFMDKAKELHIIPLIRLATQVNPRNTSVWRKPNDSDILDFANFLSSLEWPTKNKYVILFNEVNRFDEWGGEYPNPTEYAEIVSYAVDVFKNRDANFYLILGGMDAAAPNDYKRYISGFSYLTDLVETTDVPFLIDGFSSHSYPNPAFSQPPLEFRKVGVATYRYEYDLLNSRSVKKIPAFITETGWSNKTLPQSVISTYYQMTFQDIWEKDKDKIVAITPFLLSAAGEPFEQFSFFKNGKPAEFLQTILSFVKVKGDPLREQKTQQIASARKASLVAETFKSVKKKEKPLSPYVSLYFKTILGLQ